MTDLVVGASGQVGSYCMAALPSAVGTYNTHPDAGLIPLDVRDAERFEQIVREHRPRVMYLSGCLPEVDYCEANPELTYAVNVIGVRNAVEIANRYACKAVYVSSEYLFDGAAGPYDESAPANPLSVYGWQKLAAEHCVAAFARDWLIIRTAVVYSRRSRFIQWLRGALSRGETVKGLVDQISTPAYAPDLAAAMIELANRDFRGVFNICGSSLVSRYEFARDASQAFGFDPDLVAPARTAELEQRARRPLQCGLAVDKVQNALGRRMMDPAAGLRAMT
jgi:dTDP-4-dehydrorhamnose reductase